MEYLDVCEKIGNVLLWIIGPLYMIAMGGALVNVITDVVGASVFGNHIGEYRMKSHIR